MIRLDKYIASTSSYSRKEVKEYIRKGLVKVNNIIIKKDDYKVDEKKDLILLNEEKVSYEEFVYLMLNKPSGVVSATFDKKDKTILDLIDDYKYLDLFPFGRLDKDSEGLLVISNDGKLAHELLSPKKHVNKKYYVEVEGYLDNNDVKVFNEGIILDEEKCKSALLEIIESNDISKCYVTISEGKFHQIKRMFARVNKKVIYLKRITFGNLKLDESLKCGEYRKLSEEEIALLKNK